MRNKRNTRIQTLGKVIGEKVKSKPTYIAGIKSNNRRTKIFLSKYCDLWRAAIFHMEGITPNKTPIPNEEIIITKTK